ncbi:MAG: zf-HC2 domain-containing protein [Pyrinomonadaceae bacterium]
MKRQNIPNESKCLRRQIVAYVDGELNQREEFELEEHLAVCPDCRRELNDQKQMLHALDFALEKDEREFSLPENFTKVVVANAESKVSGLRRPQERFKALFVCSALFLLILLGLGDETNAVFSTFEKFFEQAWVVGGFTAHLIHDVAVGIAVISRSLCQRFIFTSAASLAGLLVFFVLTALIVSRLFVRQSRA